MNKFIPQPYKLYNKIQHYEWGTKGKNAFIPKLLGVEVETDMPYAELWIGAHPKAPSEIEVDGIKLPLNNVIEKFPKECLGEFVDKKFNGKLPFLLKVLSADRALSIQTHPNKQQAEKLHKADPVNYPDDNHKPEIAIAIDSLKAVAGFMSVNEIVLNLKSLPELNFLIEDAILKNLYNETDQAKQSILIKKIYEQILASADDVARISGCVSKIKTRLERSNNLTEAEKQFLTQYSVYGNDVGLLSFFFFNLIELKPDQAIFTSAGAPHAYLKGNIIECMANSDNVVRAGLTNKFKDVDTLLDILNYEFKKYNVMNESQATEGFVFETDASEFQVTLHQRNEFFKDEIQSFDKPSIFIVTEGEIELRWQVGEESHAVEFTKGESGFLPAALSHYYITGNSAKYYFVSIPD